MAPARNFHADKVSRKAKKDPMQYLHIHVGLLNRSTDNSQPFMMPILHKSIVWGDLFDSMAIYIEVESLPCLSTEKRLFE